MTDFPTTVPTGEHTEKRRTDKLGYNDTICATSSTGSLVVLQGIAHYILAVRHPYAQYLDCELAIGSERDMLELAPIYANILHMQYIGG